MTSRSTGFAASIALGLALAALPAAAQNYPAPSTPSQPPAMMPKAPSDSPATMPAPGRTTGMLEGSVKSVDPGAGTLQVSSGPLGMFGRTLEVNTDTQIQVEGRQGTLADLQEGSKIKASYESREGKTVATRIEVMQPPPGESTK